MVGRGLCLWHPCGIPVASPWHPRGIRVASAWHPRGFRVLSQLLSHFIKLSQLLATFLKLSPLFAHCGRAFAGGLLQACAIVRRHARAGF